MFGKWLLSAIEKWENVSHKNERNFKYKHMQGRKSNDVLFRKKVCWNASLNGELSLLRNKC